MKNVIFLLAWVLIATGVTSCTFHRIIVNEDFRNLDTSGIVVGKTTWLEVLQKLGPPTIRKMDDAVAGNVSERHLRYASSDTKTIGFYLGYYLVFPFAWADEESSTVTLIEFDENGIVSSVMRETMETKWRPFHHHAERPGSVVSLQGGT